MRNAECGNTRTKRAQVPHSEFPIPHFIRERHVGLSDAQAQAVREVKIGNTEGLHARPVMRFIDVASRFQYNVSVMNVTRSGEKVDGKSAMQMMLLEATQGCVLRIEARGSDAAAMVEALAVLVESGFHQHG